MKIRKRSLKISDRVLENIDKKLQRIEMETKKNTDQDQNLKSEH